MNNTFIDHLFRAVLRQARPLEAGHAHLLAPARNMAGHPAGASHGQQPGNRELELSLCRLPLRPGDIARGIFRTLNRIEKPAADDNNQSLIETFSRKHLEAFTQAIEKPFDGPLRFAAQATLCFGNELVREPVMVEINVRNNMGRVFLHNGRKIARCGFPTAFDTRTHIMKTTAETLIIIGKSALRKDFVLWIKKTTQTKEQPPLSR